MTRRRTAGTASRQHPASSLAYDGTPYLGWQVQPQGPTIQSVLQDGLSVITGEQVVVKGSGRTDAGVHALGQVANFHTLIDNEPTGIRHALSTASSRRRSPCSDADEVDAAFDAQFSAVNKLYRYRVFNSRRRSPFELRRSWHVNTDLDIESMSRAAASSYWEQRFFIVSEQQGASPAARSGR